MFRKGVIFERGEQANERKEHSLFICTFYCTHSQQTALFVFPCGLPGLASSRKFFFFSQKPRRFQFTQQKGDRSPWRRMVGVGAAQLASGSNVGTKYSYSHVHSDVMKFSVLPAENQPCHVMPCLAMPRVLCLESVVPGKI